VTGLPLNLPQHFSFAQSLSVLVGADDGDHGVPVITIGPTELDIGPPGVGVVLRVNEDEVPLPPNMIGASAGGTSFRPRLQHFIRR